MVERSEMYKWSSFGANGFGDHSLLNHHGEYLQLGATAEERYLNYRATFSKMNYDRDDFIRQAAHYCQPVGKEYFCKLIEQKYGVKSGQGSRGRPSQKLASV